MAKQSEVEIDMTGVKGGGRIPDEGRQTVKVDGVTMEKGNDSGKPYLKWVFEISDGAFKDSKLYHNTTLQPHALWNLKNVLTALGVPVPNGTMKMNLGQMRGRRCVVEIAHEKYDGKTQARIVEFVPLESGDGSDDSPPQSTGDGDDM